MIFKYAARIHPDNPNGAATCYTAIALETDFFDTDQIAFGTAGKGAAVVLIGGSLAVATAIDLLEERGLVLPGGVGIPHPRTGRRPPPPPK